PKSAWPGVSTMLTLVSPQRTAVFFDRIVMPRSRSSGFESITRSPTCWLARNTPAWRSIWSTNVVFPWSTCAMMAMFRICKGVGPNGGYMSGAICEGRSIGGTLGKDKAIHHQKGGNKRQQQQGRQGRHDHCRLLPPGPLVIRRSDP